MRTESGFHLLRKYLGAIPDGLGLARGLKELNPIQDRIREEQYKSYQKAVGLPDFGINGWMRIYEKTLTSETGQKIMTRLVQHYAKHGLVHLEGGADPAVIAEKVARDESFYEKIYDTFHPPFNERRLEAQPHWLSEAMHPAGILGYHDRFREALFEAIEKAQEKH